MGIDHLELSPVYQGHFFFHFDGVLDLSSNPNTDMAAPITLD